ncbi:MAG: hypothetical protein K6V97_06720 [Actinomycetia bacterium]|nr:hypothetical protein [Actinomycetes bacterium]
MSDHTVSALYAESSSEDASSYPVTSWNDAVRVILEEQYALMVRKQTDYGSGNIAAFGEMGVLVRLSDKLERLKHLLFHRDAVTGEVTWRGTNPQNETVDDTYRDILNYALIALMLRRGYWTKGFMPEDRFLFGDDIYEESGDADE